jgi:hypothetical protein
MTPGSLVAGLAIVLVQTMLLFWLSRRLLLGYVLRTLAARHSSKRGRRLIGLLRLPGNLLHEVSHAAAYLVSGYRIRRFATCLSDPDGRGYVETGRPWSPLHFGPLSAALSCAAPIVVGALAIHALGTALRVPLPAMDVTSEGVQPVATRTLTDLFRFVTHLNWAAWQTYVFWYLAFTIGAELAPSGSDLRQGFVMLCVLVLLFVLALFAVPHMELRPERAAAILGGVQWLLSTLSTALFAGLIGCGLVGLVAGAFTWVLRRSTKPASLRGRDRSRPPFRRSPPPTDRRARASSRRSRTDPRQ